MTQEDKNLLFKDLCARLPYRVKVKITPVNTENYSFNARIIEINTDDIIGTVNKNNIYCRHDIDEVKPYLFPLSSITEEQYKEYWELEHSGNMEHLSIPALDWLNTNYFDYRGLIEKGLAIDATDLNIY